MTTAKQTSPPVRSGGDSYPVVTLERWRVLKIKPCMTDRNWEVYCIGYSPVADEGVVSEPITKYEAHTGIVTTKTGDKYKLDGEPGTSRDAQHAWQKFLNKRGMREIVDVSTRYLPKR